MTSRTMNIAFVSTEVRGIHNGGIGTYVVEAARALTAAGHEVWLVTYEPENAAREQLERVSGFKHVIFVEDCPSAKDPIRFGLARATFRFAQLAHEALRDAGVSFDYIDFADYGAAGIVATTEQQLFASHGDALLAVALHSPSLDCWQHNEAMHVYGPIHREVAALEHEAIRMAPLVWAPSKLLRDSVTERLAMDPSAVPIVRYPMRFGDGDVATPPVRGCLEQLKFLYFGRIEPRKGVRELVAAFAQMPELHIECIGRDGDTSPLQSSELEYLQRSGAKNVTFRGHLAPDELAAEVRAADVVVLPSRWDNWPNACLEAMAAGRVVIGGDNSGMAEMIEHGMSGFLVRSGDADDLVRVVREDLQAALPRLGQIGAAAARRSRELSDPSCYVQTIEQLVATHRGRAKPTVEPIRSDRVSVIVPYYSEGPELVRTAVASAIAQEHENLEILVINDGSKREDAAEILAGVAAMDARVQVIHKENGGLATARNFAIEQATGDFILCLDSDNRLRDDYVRTGLRVFTVAPEAVALMPRFEVFDDATGDTLVRVQALPYDRSLALFRNTLGDGGAMFRREVFTEHGLSYDPVVDCYSDWALWLDIARKRLRVQVVPRTLYDYRIRSDSMMAGQAWRTHLAMVGLLIERHLPEGDEREMLIALTQGWGVGALLAALGRDHADWEQPQETAMRLQVSPGASAQLQAAFKELGRSHPWLGRAGGALVRAAARIHAPWKRRRGG